MVLLTSGTTGTPKGARRPSGGGGGDLAAVLDRVPWRYGETTVVAAPMFHAWGFGQLVIAAVMGNTVVTRRRFDPEATLALIEEHRGPRALGGAGDDRADRRPAGRGARALRRPQSLRFVTASGSRMRADAVIGFMDAFGDVIYNSYNATEAGQIATATPADLRVAPDTAGRPVAGTEVRILDDDGRPVPAGEVGQLFIRNTTMFEGYTSGDTKSFRDGLHGHRRPRPPRRRRPALRRRPRRRDDRVRRRERLPARGRAGRRRPRRRPRRRRRRRRRREVRPAALGLRRPRARHRGRPSRSSRTT